jgi:predicted transcriptional regulator
MMQADPMILSHHDARIRVIRALARASFFYTDDAMIRWNTCMSSSQATLNDLLQVLTSINETLLHIKQQLDTLQSQQSRPEPNDYEGLDVMLLLSLPDHLRKTAMILIKHGEATAGDVAKESGRARAVESGYLNQLLVMGHVKKHRKGRQVYFSVE